MRRSWSLFFLTVLALAKCATSLPPSYEYQDEAYDDEDGDGDFAVYYCEDAVDDCASCLRAEEGCFFALRGEEVSCLSERDGEGREEEEGGRPEFLLEVRHANFCE